ncbi:MAG: hypothetical protein JNM00_00100 [Flavobacteriales bacterium]|nr:hypothetical protein [Flavobacteriales bacterium]
MKTSDQVRHEALIDFLGTLDRYHKSNGEKLLPIVPHARFTKDCENIPTEDIHEATLVLMDVLNIRTTSSDGYRLHHILEAYIKVPDYRARLDELANEAILAKEATSGK